MPRIPSKKLGCGSVVECLPRILKWGPEDVATSRKPGQQARGPEFNLHFNTEKKCERKIEPIWWVEVSIVTSLSWCMLQLPFEMSIVFRLIAPL